LLWDFSSTQFWGEEATGTWTVTIRDTRSEVSGELTSVSLRIYGERDTGDDTYVFTDEGFEGVEGGVLEDEAGYDIINAAPVSYDLNINLSEGVIAGNGITHGIASWVVIERVYSGRGDDKLVGNATDNYLDAGRGDDTLVGAAGDDILIGGDGSDTVIYAGLINEYTISWDPDTRTVTVVDNKTSGGDEGTDTLSGIERLIFADGEVNLSETVGNQAPVINTSFFDEVVYLTEGMGIDFSLPDGVFSDPDSGTDKGLEITIRGSEYGDLPDWLAYDPITRTFTGVPPGNFQGQVKILVEASDEFGETVSDILTLQFGDNQAPQVDEPFELVLEEDSGVTSIGLTAPSDPEGESVTITITEVPNLGAILDKNGNVVSVGSQFSADEFSELSFRTLADTNGDVGYLRYEARDETGVVANSSVHFFVDAVNDAPRFPTEGAKLIITSGNEGDVELNLLAPSDVESVIEFVEITELPSLGQVTLDGFAVRLGDSIAISDLNRLVFSLSENVNGPIGAVTIQATDPEGLTTDWSLELEVSGDAGSAEGDNQDNQLYG
ncbi:MAG: proprotein convertase P-domain-containing protein, partial [Betaproteobacteria bacterium]